MRWLAVLALVLVSAFWGGHSVIGKIAEQQMSPLALTVWRFTFGGLLYLPLWYRLIRSKVWTWKLFWQVAFTGLLWAVLYPLFYYKALMYISPVQGLLLINTSPLFVILLSRLILKERIHAMQLIGILLAFGGIVWMTVGQWGHATSLLGITLTLIASLSFAGYTVSSRALTKLSLYDLLAAISLWGAIDSWIIALVSGKANQVWHALGHLNQAGWLELLYIVLIVNTIAYVLYLYGLRRLSTPVSSASTFYPQALFAALLQWVWFGDVPSQTVIISAVFILGGVLLMNVRFKRRGNFQ